MRVAYEELFHEFKRVLVSRGFSEELAGDAATVFAQNSLDGIYSHGINRFPRVVSYLDKGEIKPENVATCVSAMGAIQRWDGHRGFGPLNAKMAMDKACALAKEYGVGIVALGNNNHWMRGGTYGWQAADQGCIGICWSNTQPNMPAWGGKDKKIGNNPLIFAVPKSNGEHIVVDCAVSQDSKVTDQIVDRLIEDIHSSVPAQEGGKVFYPGEIEIGTRKDNQANGIPVIDGVWEQIKAF